MTHRMVICVLLVGFVGAALGCSLFGQPDSDNEGPPRSTTGAIPSPAQSAPPLYFGPNSIEERILSSVAVVRARLTSTTTEVVTPKTDQYHSPALKFTFSVSEYLYGNGANTITAYYVSNAEFNTAQEAESWAPTMVSRRDTQFDDREAVLFLTNGTTIRTERFSALAVPQDVYILAVGSGPIQGHSRFWIDDKYDRRWLPAASATTSASQEFLLEQPVEGSTPATITLADLKAKIATIVADINAGDGSKTYKECLKVKHLIQRHENWIKTTEPQYRMYEPDWDGHLASGLPAGTELYKYPHDGFSKTVNGTKQTTDLRLDGEDAALFSVEEINHYLSQDNTTSFDYSVVSARPIPAGTYRFNLNYRPTLLDCGATFTFPLTATLTAPDKVLHELFFDPVTVGSTVVADATNGVLEPTTFTDSDGVSASIESISYEAGKVKVKVVPWSILSPYVLDFIKLDGTASLLLNVANSTADTGNDTLIWSVSSQPWHDGDKLMVRIRKASP